MEKAMEIDANQYIAHYYTGLAHYFGNRLNGFDKIEQCFKTVIQMEPTEINSFVYLAALYAEQCQYEEAFNILQQGIETNSQNECNLLYFNLARIASCMDRMEKYQYAMNKTIEICKKFSNEKSGKLNAQLFYLKNG